jgi:hypothetical protein
MRLRPRSQPTARGAAGLPLDFEGLVRSQSPRYFAYALRSAGEGRRPLAAGHQPGRGGALAVDENQRVRGFSRHWCGESTGVGVSFC